MKKELLTMLGIYTALAGCGGGGGGSSVSTKPSVDSRVYTLTADKELANPLEQISLTVSEDSGSSVSSYKLDVSPLGTSVDVNAVQTNPSVLAFDKPGFFSIIAGGINDSEKQASVNVRINPMGDDSSGSLFAVDVEDSLQVLIDKYSPVSQSNVTSSEWDGIKSSLEYSVRNLPTGTSLENVYMLDNALIFQLRVDDENKIMGSSDSDNNGFKEVFAYILTPSSVTVSNQDHIDAIVNTDTRVGSTIQEFPNQVYLTMKSGNNSNFVGETNVLLGEPRYNNIFSQVLFEIEQANGFPNAPSSWTKSEFKSWLESLVNGVVSKNTPLGVPSGEDSEINYSVTRYGITFDKKNSALQLELITQSGATPAINFFNITQVQWDTLHSLLKDVLNDVYSRNVKNGFTGSYAPNGEQVSQSGL